MLAFARVSTVPRPALPGTSNKVHARRSCVRPPRGTERRPVRNPYRPTDCFQRLFMTSTHPASLRSLEPLQRTTTPAQPRPFPCAPASAPTWEDLLGRR